MSTSDAFHDSDLLLAVYRSEDAAENAARAVNDMGVSRVRVGARADVIASLDAEMQAEMRESWTSPQGFGVLPKEAAEGVAVGVPLAALIGMLVALPLALIPLPGALADMAILPKLLIAAIVGAVAGATVGFIAGAGFNAQGPAAPMAAEEGTTVCVMDGRAEVEDALCRVRPMRLDRLHADGSSTTVFDESDLEPAIDLSNMEDSARHPEGDWSAAQHVGDRDTQHHR